MAEQEGTAWSWALKGRAKLGLSTLDKRPHYGLRSTMVGEPMNPSGFHSFLIQLACPCVAMGQLNFVLKTHGLHNKIIIL